MMNYQKPREKKLIWVLCLVAIAIIATVVVVLLPGREQGYRTITVFETSGSVSVVNNGIEYEAYPGMLLQEGYAVVTSANSYVRMVLDDDKYVKLESGSRATFETLGVLGSGKTKINLERGALTCEIVNALEDDEEFVVNTTNAVLAVRGTFFRVDLNQTEVGEVRTDVFTYGGKVASQRILPNGEIVEEEVLIDAGYKASINMTVEETVYLTENVTVDEASEKSITPIVVSEISDEDLVDLYFASDNGHEMFLPAEEIEEAIEERELNIEEYTPTYEKAEEVRSASALSATPDDSRPLVWEETESEEEEKNQQIAGAPIDGVGTSIDVAEEPETPVEESEFQEEESEAPEEESEAPEEEPETPEEEPETPEVEPEAPEVVPETPEHVHTEVITSVEATCTETGLTTVSCSECGEVISKTEISELGHAFAVNFVIDKVPTCTEAGAQSKPCSRCDEVSELIVLAAIGHNYSTWTTITEVTCTSNGSRIRTCAICSKEETEVIVATGHSYGDWSVVVEATCEADGERKKSCSECNLAEIETVAALGHDYATDFTVDVEATCTDTGSKSKHCSRCDVTTEVTEIAATGHAITYVGTETVHGICDGCGMSVAEHDYLDVTIAATCTADGETEYSCDCGYAYTETIPMLAHTEVTTYTDGTDTADGLRRVACSVCNTTIEEETLLSIPKNFPDDVFAEYVTTNFDTDGHASLNTEELADLQAAWTVNLAGTESTDGGISSLEGIEHFTTMRILNCSYNAGLTSIDVSQCSNLSTLNINNTGLTAIDVSANTGLTGLNCTGTNISALDTSQNANLEYLYCSETNISTLDISQNTKLSYLYFAGTNIVALDNSQNTRLSYVDCSNTLITDLDFSNSTSVYELNVTNCTALTSLNLNEKTSFTNIDLTTCSGLQELGLENTGITELDLSGNTALRSLNVNGTDISTLDTGSNTELETLQCTGCYNLTTLDLSNNTKLQEVDVSYTYITAVNFGTNAELTTVKAKDARMDIDLSACNNVTTVEVSGNIYTINVNNATGLTALDVSGCSMLSELQFQNTGITTMDLSSFGSLQTVNGSGSKVTEITISAANLQTVDFSDCTSLVSLSADANYGDYFTRLNVSGCTALTTLDACGSFTTLDLSSCTNLTTLTLDSCSSLTALDLRSNTNLSELSLVGYYSQLTSLNVTGTKLATLDVSTTGLTELNVSGLTTLTQLSPGQTCSIINASNCTNLTEIQNLSNMYNVREMYLDNTQIAEISLTGTSLEKLILSNNTAVTNVELYDLYSFNTLEIDRCTSLSSLSLINISTTMTIDATTCTSLEDYNVNTSGSDNITINFQ